MIEFWETSFRDRQEMWGWEPADSAVETLELFENRKFLFDNHYSSITKAITFTIFFATFKKSKLWLSSI